MIYQRTVGWPRRIGSSGFTLVEIMVTIAVMAILMGIAIPSFTEVMLGSKLGSYANNLSSSALLARSEAIKRNERITLCVSLAGTACEAGSWEQGWIVKSGSSILHRQEALPTGLKATEASSLTSIDFSPTGAGATSATFTICRATPSVGSQERIVNISATGRVAVTKTTNGACS